MAELKVYCGTEFLGTVPRPEFRCDFVNFVIPGKNPGQPKEYWAVRGSVGDPTELRVAYEIAVYWFGENGEPPILQRAWAWVSPVEANRRWSLEFVMVVPETGGTRELLHKIPGWRPAPPSRIIDIPIF